MDIKTSKKKISTTILISMTDVIFLLIIFLLIASNFASQTGLPIRLPGSQSAVRQTHQVIQIAYASHEHILFMGKKTDMQSLQSLLAQHFESREQMVRVSADQQTPLQTVIEIMDLIRAAGYDRIFIATEAISQTVR